MTLVVVGVGAMGSALAARLVERGHDVVGVDPFLAAAGSAVETAEGVRVVHSLEDVDAAVSEVLVFVRMADQVVSVIESMDGLRAYDDVPATILSTLSPADARSVAERFGAGRRIVEAPVSGGVSGARLGALTVLMAGEPGAWLADAAATVFRFDGFGLPAAAKLLNNSLAAANAHALTAALAQADGLGLDAAQMLEVVRVSSGGGWIAENFDEFPVDLLWKDFTLLQASGPVTFPATDGRTALVEAVRTSRRRIAPEERN